MASPIVLHCAARRENHGGIQSLLACHHAHDSALGFAPRFVSCFDPVSTWSGDCVTLAGHGWETVGALRRRFARAAAQRPAAVAIYHDGWGLDWFAARDGAARRLVFLHTEQPNFDRLVRAQAPRVDGFLAVSRAMIDRVRGVVPDFPPERLCSLPSFVDPPAGFVAPAPGPGGRGAPLLLGYAGRIESTHKRLERLPALLAELDRRGVDYVFEVLGDGSYEAELRRQLAGRSRVVFLGWRGGSDYWETIARWRALVLFSDYEGLSRSGMEAMQCGVVPIHPDFSPAAAELLGPVAAHGLYPVGNMAAAADRIAALAALGPTEAAAVAQACRRHLAGQTLPNYLATYRTFVEKVLALPPRAQPLAPPAWHDWMLLGLYSRLFPQRF